MSKNQNNLLNCAHYLSKYLPLTENWIYRTVINHKAYTPILICRKIENLSLFPLKQLYCLGDLSKGRQYLEILYSKVSGYINFFNLICKRNNVKILHVHFGYHSVKMIGLKNKLKIPMLCSFYGDDAFAYPKLKGYTAKYTRLFKEADKILVLGAYMKAELINLGCPENKITIHHLGIDVTKINFLPRKITKSSTIRFLIASSFVQKKGIDLAINALSHFKNTHSFSLDLIGDGPLKAELLTVIEKSGIKDRINLHGYKPYDFFINLAYQCDVFIQASRTTEQNNKEGTPMAIVDAMAAGMAVVSTRHSDIPEIVIDNDNGYLATENDLQSLKNCIQKIFDNPDKIETFSVRGRQWIEQEFDARKQTLKLEDYYTELIQRQVKS